MPYKSNRRRRPIADRFWEKVDRTRNCWEWHGARAMNGYGTFWGDGVITMAHRFSWQLNVGPIPQGMWVLHHCDNPPCVRPDHLFLGDALDNMRNMMAKGRKVTRGHIQKIPKPRDHESFPRGEQAARSKLTDGLVRYIREEVANGTPQKVVAARLGVSQMTINRAVRGLSWSHIT